MWARALTARERRRPSPQPPLPDRIRGLHPHACFVSGLTAAGDIAGPARGILPPRAQPWRFQPVKLVRYSTKSPQSD
jgi:hypothetical protein